jgi:hypothetical protein
MAPWILPSRSAAILWVVPDGDDSLEVAYSLPADMSARATAGILGLRSVRTALDSARHLQRLTASDITDLPWHKEQPSVVICRPVSGPPDARDNRNAGIIIGIVSLPAIIESAIESTEPMGLPVEIWDTGSSPDAPAFSQGARFMDFVHPDDRDATLKAMHKLEAGVEIVNFVNRYLARDGSCRSIEWRSTVGLGGDTIFAAARDITERIALEESMRRAIAEKEALMKEVHHRVKNNMQVISSLLDLEAMQADEPRFAEAVRESQGRIRTMAMVHEQLYPRESMSDIELGIYLRELVGRVVGEYAVKDVELSIDADEIPEDLDAAIPCGLAVNELVTNACKYSHADGGAFGSAHTGTESRWHVFHFCGG